MSEQAEAIGTREPILLSRDDNEISRQMQMIERTIPVMQSIIDLYRTFEGLNPINTHKLRELFSYTHMPAAACEILRREYYDNVCAEGLRKFKVMTYEAGIKIADGVPTYDEMARLLESYSGAGNTLAYSSPNFFVIDESGELAIDDEQIDLVRKRNSAMIEFEAEHQYYSALTNLANALTEISRLAKICTGIHQGITEPDISTHNKLRPERLLEFVDATGGRFNTPVIFTPSVVFMKKVKNTIINTPSFNQFFIDAAAKLKEDAKETAAKE